MGLLEKERTWNQYDHSSPKIKEEPKLKMDVRAFTAVELKSYNAILAPLIYQKHLAAVVVKQNFFADLLQCTSIYRCAL